MNASEPTETATAVAGWTDADVYSPAPRHRRWRMLDWLRELRFTTLLDARYAHADVPRALAAEYPEGFPFHSLYKWASNAVSPEAIYSAFGEHPNGFLKKGFCHFLYPLFLFNAIFPSTGGQLLLLAERTQP